MLLKKFAGFFRRNGTMTDLSTLNPSPRMVAIGKREKPIYPLVLRDWEEMIGDLTGALTKLAAKAPTADVSALMQGDVESAKIVLLPIYDEILGLVAKCLGETTESLRGEMTLVQLLRAIRAIMEVNDLSEVVGNFKGLFLGKPKATPTAGGQR